MSEAEEQAFLQAVQSDPEFERLFEDYRMIWNVSETIYPNREPIVDVNAQWAQFEHMTREAKSPKVVKLSPRFWLTRVAAVVVLILSAVFVYQQLNRDAFETGLVYATNASDETLYSLTDGSNVYVGTESKLEVEDVYNRENRRTRLHGNAFFVVKPDKDRVFEVVTDHLVTRVKGTTFLIRTSDHSTTVGVRTGVVEVLVGNQTEILTAGQSILVSADGGMIKRSVLEENDVLALLDETTHFENVQLKSILNHLKTHLNLIVQAPEAMMSNTYTMDIEGLNTKQILEVLQLLTKSSIEQKGEIYILKQ
ncbi:MAG: FecR domain-containing protein [Flavobacteriales bacterium]|nr:FecR domain-containing protein [Bacteroidota bacterium]MCB9239623.1 FecR domain-containing protein [Flavobacteriales bacterium]